MVIHWDRSLPHRTALYDHNRHTLHTARCMRSTVTSMWLIYRTKFFFKCTSTTGIIRIPDLGTRFFLAAGLNIKSLLARNHAGSPVFEAHNSALSANFVSGVRSFSSIFFQLKVNVFQFVGLCMYLRVYFVYILRSVLIFCMEQNDLCNQLFKMYANDADFSLVQVAT